MHPLVKQLYFARSEFQRCLAGISPEDAQRRLMPNNSVSWIVGHLANQEHAYWVLWGQAENIAPGLNDLVGYGKPATTPPIDEMWAMWEKIAKKADDYLGALTASSMQEHLAPRGKPLSESVGTLLLRNIYHYWFHTGEAHAIRQQMGHQKLPDFVGRMAEYPYMPE